MAGPKLDNLAQSKGAQGEGAGDMKGYSGYVQNIQEILASINELPVQEVSIETGDYKLKVRKS